ncbi:hypothetical protein EWH99_03885 [Sporolactobacillus sp. THM7-7]|nr:hypothetical protein EWH99_03885 [Sporolactobacillus sp. THM7-7]
MIGRNVTAMFDILAYMMNDPMIPTLLLFVAISLRFIRPLRFNQSHVCSTYDLRQMDSCTLITLSMQEMHLPVHSFVWWLARALRRKENADDGSEDHISLRK